MAGTPGHSGGKRAGAGRPPQTRTLRSGQQILVHEADTNGNYRAPGDMATVEVVSRTMLVLHLRESGKIIIGY
jgi:hypothetical protein